MTRCPHRNLLLLSEPAEERLRCRHCHLTIARSELGRGPCPECFEERGKRHTDFDVLEPELSAMVRYRCEDCGAFVEAGGD